jgi:molybdopterin molybdotransferase
MWSVKEVKEILQNQQMLCPLVQMPVELAFGRFLAKVVESCMDVPSFDNSAMDGYAVQFDPGVGVRQISFTVPAGNYPKLSLEKNQAARIYTGAALPVGADTVIPQEFVDIRNGEIHFDASKFPIHSNVRFSGSQCKLGESIALRHQKITPGLLALLLSCGIQTVHVFSPPRIGLIVTGDEIVDVGTALKAGQVYNTNGPAVKACLSLLGIHQLKYAHVCDDQKELEQKIAEMLSACDVLILTGGISVGDRDYVKECLEKNDCKPLFYKVKQRPGKPLYCARKEDGIVFALPGNPASVLSCMRQYVMPFILQMMGHQMPWQANTQIPLASDYSKKSGLTFFVKAKATHDAVFISNGQESFNLLSFSESESFAELPEEAGFVEKGTVVPVYNWCL